MPKKTKKIPRRLSRSTSKKSPTRKAPPKSTLKMKRNKLKNILIDIDGTVSEDIPNEESYRFSNANVLNGAVDGVNKLYNSGNCQITFFTARTEDHRLETKKWLDKHGFKYHGLLMGKPRGGNYIWIDNLDVKGIKYDEKENNWEKILKSI